MNIQPVLDALDHYNASYTSSTTEYRGMSYVDIRCAEEARVTNVARNGKLLDELLDVVENNIPILKREATPQEIEDVRCIRMGEATHEDVSDVVVFTWVIRQISHTGVTMTPKLRELLRYYVDAIEKSRL